MANGDKAAAKGWSTVPSTKAHSTGNDDLNRTMDYVAQEIDDRAAADLLKVDKANIIISTTTPTVVNGALWFKPTS
jgi:hypothetical protein